MARAWVITGECGDYYCGCGEGHLIGVTLNPDLVEGLVTSAKGIKHSYAHGSTYHDYTDVRVTELELDLVYPRNLTGVTHTFENTDRTQDGAESLET